MALIKVKVKKAVKYDGQSLKEGDEIVVHRKSSQENFRKGNFEQVGKVLDPRNADDKPLIDEWMESHSFEEKPAKKSKK